MRFRAHLDLHLSLYEVRYLLVPNLVHEPYESIRSTRGGLEPLVSAVARPFRTTLDSERLIAAQRPV
jgi:hypothetical protein